MIQAEMSISLGRIQLRLNFEVRRLTKSFQADRYPRGRGHRPLNSNR